MNQYGAGGENPFNAYYVKQAGGGMPYFSGMRTQRGHGWFSRFLSNSVVPAMKTLGQRALVTGANIGTDILEGKDAAESAKTHLVTEGKNLANDVIKRAKRAAQTGSGITKRTKRKNNFCPKQLGKGSRKHKSKTDTPSKKSYPFLA